jgi:hypothetical protein
LRWDWSKKTERNIAASGKGENNKKKREGAKVAWQETTF